MRAWEEQKEIDKIYDTAKARIKERIERKGVSTKGSAKGTAINEIVAVLDDELGIGIAEEMQKAKREIRQYCSKYDDVELLETKLKENKQKLEEQQTLVNIVSLLTDEVLKNAIIAYNALHDRYHGRGDAKDIVDAYIKSKGRGDLEERINAGDELLP